MSSIEFYCKIISDEIVLYYDSEYAEVVPSTDLFLNKNYNYIFHQSHESNSSCDIQFSYFINGMIPYNFDNTFLSYGIPGEENSYTAFSITENARDYIYMTCINKSITNGYGVIRIINSAIPSDLVVVQTMQASDSIVDYESNTETNVVNDNSVKTTNSYNRMTHSVNNSHNTTTNNNVINNITNIYYNYASPTKQVYGHSPVPPIMNNYQQKSCSNNCCHNDTICGSQNCGTVRSKMCKSTNYFQKKVIDASDYIKLKKYVDFCCS